MFSLIPVNPSIWNLKPIFEVRERFERRTDRDFNGNKNDNTSDLYSRWRLGARVTGPNKISGELVLQESHDLQTAQVKNYSTERLDVLLGYLQGTVLGAQLTAGRIRLIEGDQRLLGESDWNNLSTSWDGAKWSSKTYDLFYGHLAVNNLPNTKAQIGGGTYLSTLGQSMLIFKDDRQALTTSWTLDQYFTKTMGSLSVESNTALQQGSIPGKKLEAWAIEAKAAYRLIRKISIFGEYFSASGGSDSSTSFTFDQLYPYQHNRYGLLDLQGWKNTDSWDTGATWSVTKQTTVVLKYSKFALRDASDDWYTGTGLPNKLGKAPYVDPSGSKGKDIGDEVDLYADHKLTTTQAIGAGVGLFRPGNFIKAFNPGASENQLFAYLYYSLKI